MLHQVGRGMVVAQVALAVAPHARRQQAVQLRLGLALPGGRRLRDAAGE
jgi:hypothetical protein